MKTYSHADTMTTAQCIADYANLYPAAEVAVDEVGAAGIFDRLKALLGQPATVTLTGAGGMGKTRLALAVAAASLVLSQAR